MGSFATVRARNLRWQDNPAERALWAVLKNRQLAGSTFTRQYPIGPYIADFACRRSAVVIEVDGSQHLERAAQDRMRDEYMIRAGYSVFRVPSAFVLNHSDAVCETLLGVLEDWMAHAVDAPDLRFIRAAAPVVRRDFPRAAPSGSARAEPPHPKDWGGVGWTPEHSPPRFAGRGRGWGLHVHRNAQHERVCGALVTKINALSPKYCTVTEIRNTVTEIPKSLHRPQNLGEGMGEGKRCTKLKAQSTNRNK